MLVANDSLGGGGSISPSIAQIATSGLSRLVDGVLSKKFPLTSFNETATTTTGGKLNPAGAPQETKNLNASIGEILSSPVALVAFGGIAIAAALFLALRK